jgi:hypothetical protein
MLIWARGEGSWAWSSNEPYLTSLRVQALSKATLHPAPTIISWITTKMTTTPPPLDFEHLSGFQIATKHKEAIRQLHWFSHVPIQVLTAQYKLNESSIRRILSFDCPERRRPKRTGSPFLLSDAKVDEIINDCSESWDYHIVKFGLIRVELGLKCST